MLLCGGIALPMKLVSRMNGDRWEKPARSDCKRADQRQRRPQADRERAQEAEQQAGEDRRHRLRLGDEERGQRDEALAGRHVLHEAGIWASAR